MLSALTIVSERCWAPALDADVSSRCLMCSAKPARVSRSGRVRKNSGFKLTPAGVWKVPTRFLPPARLIPVLPPVAASTMPRRVVGMSQKFTPRQ